MVYTRGIWWLLASIVAAQTVAPSNNSADLLSFNSSPRFYINSSSSSVQFPGFEIAPLGQYAYISHNVFMNILITGFLVNTDASNANKVRITDFNYVSCDPEDYVGGNIDASGVLRIIANQSPQGTNDRSSLIFYSTRSNHCNVTSIAALPAINGIFTTLDPNVALQIRDRNFTESSNAAASLTPNRNSYVDSSSGGGGGGGYAQPPTTAIAMIVLYSITGIITALFIVIIITGAVRAHRHPERYGPRVGAGRQSRAKGIARAMLETLPIVKFGDHHDDPKQNTNSNGQRNAPDDIEMAPASTPEAVVESSKTAGKNATTTTTPIDNHSESASSKSKENVSTTANPDGRDETGALGCSICTEDFQKGEEVRVLPCNHKFHPDCVDPWLLNVSGTCPLCRISLAPEGGDEAPNAEGDMPPPLNSASDRRSQHIHSLMALAYGSREERVLALQRYRAERRNRNSALPEEERVSRARRFREALRIRTRTHETNEVEQDMHNRGVDAISGPQMRL